MGRGVVFEVDDDIREVATVYADGHAMHALRSDTPDNRAEAAEQGYHGADAVWGSLAEHEALHTLLTRALDGRESRVLRHESGAERHRYALRLHEEARVISFQTWLNTGVVDPALEPHRRQLGAIRSALVGLGLFERMAA